MWTFFEQHRIEIFAFTACLGLVGLILELVRRKKIKEKYSFLWFITGLTLMLLTLKRTWLASLAGWMGIFYPPSALFIVLSFFIILILVHYSIVLSELLTENQKLAQKIALLETEIRENRPSAKAQVH